MAKGIEVVERYQKTNSHYRLHVFYMFREAKGHHSVFRQLSSTSVSPLKSGTYA